MTDDLVGLEAAINEHDDVLGCVIFASQDDDLSEVQVFTRPGASRASIEDHVSGCLGRLQLLTPLKGTHVFELEGDEVFGDRDTLVQVAEVAAASPEPHNNGAILTRRPSMTRVRLDSTAWTSEAEVALAAGTSQVVVGQASGRKTPLGLKVVAQATVDAANRLLEEDIVLQGASLVEVFGQDAVLVIVVHGSEELLGAALLRKGPVADATVRATLDALNRRFVAAT